MKKEWQLTEEAFNRFLDWLDPDREQAARKYKEMQRNLIAILGKRRCHCAEDLADEAFNRAIRRLPNMPDPGKVAPAAYIMTIAKNLYLEYIVSNNHNAPLPDSDYAKIKHAQFDHRDDFEDEALNCLDDCLNQLEPENRNLILDYYREARRARIENRQKLAQEYGLSFNALRIRVCRIKENLRKCLDGCLDKASNP